VKQPFFHHNEAAAPDDREDDKYEPVQETFIQDREIARKDYLKNDILH
jgi:hypothetical protein